MRTDVDEILFVVVVVFFFFVVFFFVFFFAEKIRLHVNSLPSRRFNRSTKS